MPEKSVGTYNGFREKYKTIGWIKILMNFIKINMNQKLSLRGKGI